MSQREYITCICPKCGREMSEVFIGDAVRRVRCWVCDLLFSEIEYILQNGEMLVRRIKKREVEK